MDIIDRVFYLLDEQNKKPVELCEFLGINQSSLSTWKGRHTDPPVRHLAGICKFFRITADYLLTGEESPYADSGKSQPKLSFSDDEIELVDIYRSLPLEKRFEFKGEMKGYAKALSEQKYHDVEKRLSI